MLISLITPRNSKSSRFYIITIHSKHNESAVHEDVDTKSRNNCLYKSKIQIETIEYFHSKKIQELAFSLVIHYKKYPEHIFHHIQSCMKYWIYICILKQNESYFNCYIRSMTCTTSSQIIYEIEMRYLCKASTKRKQAFTKNFNFVVYEKIFLSVTYDFMR